MHYSSGTLVPYFKIFEGLRKGGIAYEQSEKEADPQQRFRF